MNLCRDMGETTMKKRKRRLASAGDGKMLMRCIAWWGQYGTNIQSM
jgi:hypothetical protein